MLCMNATLCYTFVIVVIIHNGRINLLLLYVDKYHEWHEMS